MSDPVTNIKNDPRVFFGAERNLLAWNRTGVSLMAFGMVFGFVIERFGLYLDTSGAAHATFLQPNLSFVADILFVLAAVFVGAMAVVQFNFFVKGLSGGDVPFESKPQLGLILSVFVALPGIALVLYLSSGFLSVL